MKLLSKNIEKKRKNAIISTGYPVLTASPKQTGGAAALYPFSAALIMDRRIL